MSLFRVIRTTLAVVALLGLIVIACAPAAPEDQGDGGQPTATPRVPDGDPARQDNTPDPTWPSPFLDERVAKHRPTRIAMLTVDGKSDLYVLNGDTNKGDDLTDAVSDAIEQKKLYIEPTLNSTDAKIGGSLRTALYAYLSREPFTHHYCDGLEDDYQDYDHSTAAARANYNPYIRKDNYRFRVGDYVYIDLLLNGDDLVAQQASSDAVIKFLSDNGVPQSELPVSAPNSDDYRIFLVNGWVHFSFLRPLARLPEIYRVNPAESASAERLDLLFRIAERSGNDLGLEYSMPGCNITSDLLTTQEAPESESASVSGSSGRTTSAGVDLHGVSPWHQAGIKGGNGGGPMANRPIRIGIIDEFAEIDAASRSNDLPPLNEMRARCYTGRVADGIITLNDAAGNLNPRGSCQRRRWVDGIIWLPLGIHGTEVAEIIHDIAPEADLYLASPLDTQELIDAVGWMVANEVDVINMSGGFAYASPGDGASFHSSTNPKYFSSALQAVELAHRADIVWVNAAGNSNTDRGGFDKLIHWVGNGLDVYDTYVVFATDRNEDGRTDYADPTDYDNCNGFKMDKDDSYTFTLRWEDQWPGADNSDLNLELYHYQSGVPVRVALGGIIPSGRNLLNLTYPAKRLSYSPTSNKEHKDHFLDALDDDDYCIRIKISRGYTPDYLQMVSLRSASVSPVDLEYATEDRNITEPADSNKNTLLAVAAAHVTGIINKSLSIADYSSRGPAIDSQPKPDITGLSRVSTSRRFWGGKFQGTSAAAPHVAGLAALTRQVFPHKTAAEVVQYLKDNAVPPDTISP